MKLVFFGTGRVAVPTFERVRQSPHTMAACITQPDRPKGRGLRQQPSPVCQAAQAHGIACLQPERLDHRVAQQLQALQPEVGVVVDYGHKIPPVIVQIPRRGFLGLHPSLLPKYRGAAPIQRALLAGDEMTGTTVFRVTEAMDSGDILLQDMTAIRPDETAVELSDRLAQQGAELMARALDLLDRGEVQWHRQDERAATPAPKLTKLDGRIDWRESATAIVNRIRALQPWPGAFTTWHGKTLKLWRARLAVGCAVAAPGTVMQLSDKGILVSASEGGVLLTSLQPEGGREMSAAAFCHGRLLRIGDTFK